MERTSEQRNLESKMARKRSNKVSYRVCRHMKEKAFGEKENGVEKKRSLPREPQKMALGCATGKVETGGKRGGKNNVVLRAGRVATRGPHEIC